MANPLGAAGIMRAPNSDFSGRSFQGVSGPPSSMRTTAPGSLGIGNVPGQNIEVGEIMRDTSGRRSNATVQYHRVVPMREKLQKEYVKKATAGTLVFACRRQSRQGHGVERLSEIVTWDYLNDDCLSNSDSAKTTDTPDQRYQSMTDFPKLSLTSEDAKKFDLEQGYLNLKEKEFEVSEGDKKTTSYELKTEFMRSKFMTGEDSILRKLSQYVPDGVVLYKYSTEGSNTAEEERLDAFQNGLFNLVVSGHATLTSWATLSRNVKNRQSLRVLPRDTLYIAIVATPIDLAPIDNAAPIAGFGPDYDIGEVISRLCKDGKNVPLRQRLQKPGEGSVLAEFKLVRTTSEFLHKNQGAVKPGLVDEGQVIVGAWRIGSVVDSAATRAVDAVGNSTSSTMQGSMGMTASIGIRWVSSIDLFETYSRPLGKRDQSS